MIGRRVTWTAMALFFALAASACGDKKDPLTPDNPNADPLMMEAGAPEVPSPAGSASTK